MQSISTNTISKPMMWTGRVLSALVTLFLVFDFGIKLLQMAPAIESTVQLGYVANLVRTIGIIELICFALYLIPPTSVFGAILMTGYLGGAIATHVRAGSDTFSIIFTLIIAAMLWGALYIRNPHLRAMIPVQR